MDSNDTQTEQPSPDPGRLLQQGLVGLAAAGAAYALYRISTSVRRHLKYKLPPEQWGVPILGSGVHLLKDPVNYFSRTRETMGPVWTLQTAFTNTIILAEDDALEWFERQEKLGTLETGFSMARSNPISDLFGRHHLLATSGQAHQSARKTVFKALSPVILNKRVEDFEKIYVRYFDEWSAHGGFVRNMERSLGRLSFDVAVEVVLGDSVADPEFEKELGMLYEWYRDVTHAFAFFIPFKVPGTLVGKAYTARKKLNEFWKRVLSKRRENINRESPTLIDLLLIHQDENEDDEIVNSDAWLLDQIVLIFFAAHETTSSAWSNVLHILQTCPEQCASVIAELRDYDPNDRFQFLRSPTVMAFLKEVLRYSNIVSGVIRVARKDLKYKEWDIPKGWGVQFVLQAPHENNWENALQFEPSRFFHAPRFATSQKVGLTESKFNWAPFGAGVHACVGKHVAQMQMSLFLCILVRHYKFKIDLQSVHQILGATRALDFDCVFFKD